MTNKLFLFALIAAFIPYSWSTPLGYVSLVDCAVFIFLTVSLASAFSKGAIRRPSMVVMGLSMASFCAVLISQAANGLTSDVSILIKYFVFLVAIPTAMAFGGVNLHAAALVRRVPSVLSVAGTIVATVALVQIFRGSVRAGEGAYYIDFFGQLINKNGLALILMYGLLASAVCAVHRRNKFYIAACIYQLAITFYIGARAATLVDLILIQAIYLYFSKITATRLILYVLAMALGCLLVFGLAESGLAGAQIQRLVQVANTDTSTVTASTSRILLWVFALHEIAKSPWIGSGYGTFSYVGNSWLDGMYEPHNNILQIMYAGGLIGFSIFLVLVFFGMRTGFKISNGRSIAMILMGYLLSTLVDIIWVRGDGHIFWLLFFLVALTPKAPDNVNSRRKTLDRKVEADPIKFQDGPSKPSLGGIS